MQSRFLVERLEVRRLLASGNPDPSFGSNGVVSGYSEIFPGGSAQAVAVQSDGKIIAAGGTGDVNFDYSNPAATSNFALTRLLPNGSPDLTFGTSGSETVVPQPYCYIQSLALQPDGKIVVAGSGGASVNDSHLIVGRFNADGTPDTTFGTNGFVSAAIKDFDTIAALSIQSDGKVVVLANSTAYTGTDVSAMAVAVLRYTATGAPDPTFGTAGSSLIFTGTDAFGPSAKATAVDRNGDILVEADDSQILYVERLTTAGAPDPRFGDNGVAQEPFDQNFTGFTGTGMAVQPDGRVVVVGDGGGVNGSFYDGIIATRFTAAGAVDKTFGRAGKTGVTLTDHTGGDPEFFVQNANATPVGLALQPDGKLIIAGYVTQIGLDFQSNVGPTRFAAVRLTASGALDPTFGAGGKVQFGTGNLWPTLNNYTAAVAIAPDGSVVLAGTAQDDGANGVISDGFEFLKLSPSGTLDPRFGYQGRVGPFPIAPPAQLAAIQSDGKTVLATSSSLARLMPDGSLDPSFGKGGLVLDSDDFVDDNVQDISRSIVWLSVLANGDILAAYSVTTHYQSSKNSQTFTEIRRFRSNGFPEASFGVRRLVVPQNANASSTLQFDAMSVLPDGKIVLVSTAPDSNTVIVTRYSRSGALDPSFGSNGATILQPFGAAAILFSRIDFSSFSDEIILGGIGTIASASNPNNQQSELVLLALDQNGKIVPDFSQTHTQPRALTGSGSLLDMTVTDSGWIYVLTQDGNGLALSRYYSEGDLDSQFGNNGQVAPVMPANMSAVGPFFIQPDGAFVGLTASGVSPYLNAAVRFTPFGALDVNFGNQGVATLPAGTPIDVVARAFNGTIILTDSFSAYDDGSYNQIVRLLG